MVPFLQKLAESLNFLNKNNSPKNKQVIKESAVIGDVIIGDKYHTNSLTFSPPSNLEKKVLKYLHIKTVGKRPEEKISTIYKDLEISEGTNVQTLNDSKYLIVGSDEISINSEGVRYMDNLSPEELRKIILPEEQRRIDIATEEQKMRIERYRRENNSRPSQWE